ncbi:uncharacterized protein LOC132718833 [Ruditapes philippinarum]|uniref:uncharacterized protein LOC132718833 n=1 Tax=Ruditapes philippinarum TaxID=129788 RepID=UPI00295AC807|nr:uncharacterized protein LOC132718833 [Ruditapes philippinarum]
MLTMGEAEYKTRQYVSETENCDYKLQLRYLIKDRGQQTFRLLIQQSLQKSKTNLSSFLQESENKETVCFLRTEHVITDEDFELLYPKNGSPSLENAGFTILYIIMRTFFCDIPRNDRIWDKGSKPEPNDLSRAANIVRLRDHISELEENELTKDIFEEKCNELHQIFTHFGTEDVFKEVSDPFKIDSFDEETENTLREEFRKWELTQQYLETGLDLHINESKTRRFRLYSLLVDGGTRVFKHIFDDKIPPADLQTVLSNPTTKGKLLYLRTKKVLIDSQEHLLYPSQGSPQSTTFDITLLAILLRNICGFNQFDKRWDDKNPVAADISTIADIVRIREARNEVISHLSQTGKLSKDEFERHWNGISKVLLRLDGWCKVPFENLKSEIDDLKSKHLDPEQEKEYQCIIENWKRIDEQLESKMLQYLKQSILGNFEYIFIA